MNVQTPNLQITNSSLLSNNICAEHEHKLITELINNLNQIKSHPQKKLNGKDQGKRDANTRTTQRCVIEEETEALSVKPLHRPLSGQ